MRLIDADNINSITLEDSCHVLTYEKGGEIVCEIDAPTVDAIPTEWIREQMCEYPGMESAMWSKLLRIWKREGRQ